MFYAFIRELGIWNNGLNEYWKYSKSIRKKIWSWNFFFFFVKEKDSIYKNVGLSW